MLEDEISFNSQNPEIATVDSNGVITGISKGSTTVEVTVGNKTKMLSGLCEGRYCRKSG